MSQELLNARLAAETLADMLPERTADQWELWLRNNRNQARKAPYRLPVARMSNAAFYSREDLAKFVEWEKSRRLGKVTVSGRAAEVMRAFGIGESSGGVHGRRFGCTVTVQQREGDRLSYVQLVVHDPLLVFRLDEQELDALTLQLVKAKAELSHTGRPA